MPAISFPMILSFLSFVVSFSITNICQLLNQFSFLIICAAAVLTSNCVDLQTGKLNANVDEDWNNQENNRNIAIIISIRNIEKDLMKLRSERDRPTNLRPLLTRMIVVEIIIDQHLSDDSNGYKSAINFGLFILTSLWNWMVSNWKETFKIISSFSTWQLSFSTHFHFHPHLS